MYVENQADISSILVSIRGLMDHIEENDIRLDTRFNLTGPIPEISKTNFVVKLTCTNLFMRKNLNIQEWYGKKGVKDFFELFEKVLTQFPSLENLCLAVVQFKLDNDQKTRHCDSVILNSRTSHPTLRELKLILTNIDLVITERIYFPNVQRLSLLNIEEIRKKSTNPYSLSVSSDNQRSLSVDWDVCFPNLHSLKLVGWIERNEKVFECETFKKLHQLTLHGVVTSSESELDNYPNLGKLCICGSTITHFKSIRDLDNLKNLQFDMYSMSKICYSHTSEFPLHLNSENNDMKISLGRIGQLMSFFRNKQCLESLMICGFDNGSFGDYSEKFEIQDFPSLKHVHLEYVNSKVVLRNTPQVKTVHLRSGHVFDFEEIGDCMNLEEITTECVCHVGSFLLRNLSKLKNLRVVRTHHDVDGAWSLDEELRPFIVSIRNMKNLEILELVIQGVGESRQDITVNRVENCRKLSRLVIIPDSCDCVFKNLPSLSQVEIVDNYLLNQQEIFKIVSNLVQSLETPLDKLLIRSRKKLININRYPKYFGNIKHLRFYTQGSVRIIGDMIGDEETFLSNFRDSLEVFSTGWCRGHSIYLRNLRNLREVVWYSARRISSYGEIRPIVISIKNCSFLTTIDLYMDTMFAPNQFKIHLKDLRNCRILRLRGESCYLISKFQIDPQSVPIRELHVEYYQMLDDESIIEISNQFFPSLEILKIVDHLKENPHRSRVEDSKVDDGGVDNISELPKVRKIHDLENLKEIWYGCQNDESLKEASKVFQSAFFSRLFGDSTDDIEELGLDLDCVVVFLCETEHISDKDRMSERHPWFNRVEEENCHVSYKLREYLKIIMQFRDLSMKIFRKLEEEIIKKELGEEKTKKKDRKRRRKMRECSVCGVKRKKMTRCSECFKKRNTRVYYCSRKCQRSDWKSHKSICGK